MRAPSGHRFFSRSLLVSALALPAVAAALVAGCGDDDSAAPADAGSDVSVDTTPPRSDSGHDAGVDARPDAQAQVARGKYLVDHVAACADCHTPRTVTGQLDRTRYLAGAVCFVDSNGRTTDGGCLHSANLTNDPTGLKNRTDEQIKTMFQDGKRPDGRNLVPVMPYWVFHNMTADDADAVVAYLRTVPAVSHQVPPNDPPFDNVPTPAAPIDPSTIPPANGAGPQRGRYLSAMAGVCLECHTPAPAQPGARPVDMTRPFAGGRRFPSSMFGPGGVLFPENIYTANLTPHTPTGIGGWTAQDIVRVIKHGRDREDAGTCPPMPTGPMGAFGGITDEDALDIATYLLSLPPIENANPNGCKAP